MIAGSSGSSQPSPTFRDPAGSVSIEADRVIRSIHPSARQSVLDFIESGFYRRMVERGDMVGSTIDDGDGDSLRLIHPNIPIPTYPWEWTPTQWLAAAELTLTLCREAVAEGLILKDATPLNILFVGSRPIFVDVLSFERRDPNSAIWLAYGQYMRTFLLPLLMNKVRSWPLALTFFKRDGYEPIDLYTALGWSQRLSRAVFWPITLPALFEKKKTTDAPKPPARKIAPEAATHILLKTVEGLRERTRRAVPPAVASEWSDYTSNLTHYTAEQSAAKHDWVSAVLKELKPSRVLDIGANTGVYSALAASCGCEVISLERDPSAADRLFAASRDIGTHSYLAAIQTINADLARPTPPAGWDLRESSALIPRLEQQCDLVMMLAVIHHLILMEQIPVPAIMALMHRLTRSHLIVEWVPVPDPMFQSLLRGREDLYGQLSEADLLNACDGFFSVARREVLGNNRILFLLSKI